MMAGFDTRNATPFAIAEPKRQSVFLFVVQVARKVMRHFLAIGPYDKTSNR